MVLTTLLRINEGDGAIMMQGPNRTLYFNTPAGQIKRWGQYNKQVSASPLFDNFYRVSLNNNNVY
jgi:hypothetical protein